MPRRTREAGRRRAMEMPAPNSSVRAIQRAIRKKCFESKRFLHPLGSDGVPEPLPTASSRQLNLARGFERAQGLRSLACDNNSSAVSIFHSLPSQTAHTLCSPLTLRFLKISVMVRTESMQRQSVRKLQCCSHRRSLRRQIEAVQ